MTPPGYPRQYPAEPEQADWRVLTRSQRIKVWFGVGAAGVQALLILAVGLGFLYYAITGHGVVMVVGGVLGLIITAVGGYAARSTYRMVKLRLEAAWDACKCLVLPGILFVGAFRGMLYHGFHVKYLFYALALAAYMVTVFALIAYADTTVRSTLPLRRSR